MTILQLAQAQAKTKAEALAVIDQLRAQIESGEAIAFVGATLSRADGIFGWATTTEPVSRLRMMGAIAHLTASYHAGDL